MAVRYNRKGTEGGLKEGAAALKTRNTIVAEKATQAMERQQHIHLIESFLSTNEPIVGP